MGLNPSPFEYLTFNGKSSAEFGVWISGGGTYNAPARDVEMVSVPGRNGDISYDNGRFQNVAVTYPAFISRKFKHRIDDFRSWMCSHIGYQRLEDTYHPEEYRLAMYKSGLNVMTAPRNLAGSFDLVFECKPQRFLKSGELPMIFDAAGVIYNPTDYAAKPLIRCHGTSGTVTVGGVSVAVTGATSYVDIDCELMEVYEGSTSRNNTTTLTNGEFPEIAPGEAAVSFTGFSSVEITPNWYMI